jgi:hypothetical protein
MKDLKFNNTLLMQKSNKPHNSNLCTIPQNSSNYYSNSYFNNNNCNNNSNYKQARNKKLLKIAAFLLPINHTVTKSIVNKMPPKNNKMY